MSPGEPVADRAVAERAGESAGSERGVHEAEIGRAPVLLPREDGQHDRQRRLEQVGDEDREHECAQQTLIPDEAHAVGQLREESSATLACLLARVRSRHEDDDESGRDQKARGIEPEGCRCSERSDEHAADRRAYERRALLDARRGFHWHAPS